MGTEERGREEREEGSKEVIRKLEQTILFPCQSLKTEGFGFDMSLGIDLLPPKRIFLRNTHPSTYRLCILSARDINALLILAVSHLQRVPSQTQITTRSNHLPTSMYTANQPM